MQMRAASFVALASGALASGLVATGCAPDPPTAIVGIVAVGCHPGRETGSGALVDDATVLTSAHTLRGAQSVSVTLGDTSVDAEIVGFDPDLDLAYLHVDLPGARPFDVDSSGIDAGDRGRAWVVRRGEPVPIDVTIERRIRLRTEDIYVEGETERPAFELSADIERGDSGGPVVVDGNVVGVVWARSREAAGRAYAIDPDRGGARIDEQVESGDLGDVDVSRCD